MSHYEMRIFFRKSDVDIRLWRRLRDLTKIPKPVAVEKRKDVYFDLSCPGLGLKLRGKSKVELKIRLSNSSPQEEWEKVFTSSNVQTSASNLLSIIQNNAKNHLDAPKAIELLSTIDSAELEERMIGVQKKRRNMRLGPKTLFESQKSIDCEQANIKLTVSGEPTSEKWRSIALEGNDPNSLQQAMDKLVPEWNMNNKVLVMGYPEFVAYARHHNGLKTEKGD